MIDASRNSRWTAINEFFGVRASCAPEFDHQLSWNMPAAIGDHDPEQHSSVSVTGIANA
jgi:hypothetical protein